MVCKTFLNFVNQLWMRKMLANWLNKLYLLHKTMINFINLLLHHHRMNPINLFVNWPVDLFLKWACKRKIGVGIRDIQLAANSSNISQMLLIKFNLMPIIKSTPIDRPSWIYPSRLMRTFRINLIMKKILLILKEKRAQLYLMDGDPLAMRIIIAIFEASRTFHRFPTIVSWTSA